MADTSLQDRLRDHAKAFDGLLSLIPAKMYYGEDTSDQWQKKKQTKTQAAEARRNKLDPDSELNRSAKEVMDEQARKKRKRDEGQVDDDDDEWSDVPGVELETPGQGLKNKKQKVVEEAPEMTEKERRKEEKKAARKARKAERQALRDEEAAYERRSVKSGVNKIKLGPRESKAESRQSSDSAPSNANTNPVESVEVDEDDEAKSAKEPEIQDLDVAGIVEEDQDHQSDSAPPSAPGSPLFDTNGTPTDSVGQAPSTTTSVSSADHAADKPKPHLKIPKDTTALRVRLAAKIQALRDARKADGPDGKPIRTRQELIESRREKQAERKAHKKELRRLAKIEEDRKREEALASSRNSPGSILSPSVDLEDSNFAFGRVSFADGTQMSHDLSHVLNSAKKKGASDPKTALQKLQNDKKRLQGMDKEKRNDVEEKEAWLTARKRAEGEKIRDDEKLLKKAVKRKESNKKKSEKAWADRAEGVKNAIKARQQKREDNIRQRKEQKMLGKFGKKKSGFKKHKGRAGFEGSFSVGGKKK